MAIERQFFSLIMQVRRVLLSKRNPIRALFLAYPDILMRPAELEEFVAQDLLVDIPVRQDSKQIWTWHGLSSRNDAILDSISLFRALGFATHVIDIISARGSEEIVDLNYPLPAHLHENFDVVIDTGTCEHCFNVGQAFANACAAVAPGGFLIHAAPMSRTNHGFWNFCPTVYPDFFDDNGFKLHLLTGVSVDLENGFKTVPVQIGRFISPPELIMFVVAQKVSTKPLKWPVQRKYR